MMDSVFGLVHIQSMMLKTLLTVVMFQQKFHEIERDSYQVKEGDSLRVKLKRTGGTEGEVSVHVTTPPGMAVQGQYYESKYKD